MKYQWQGIVQIFNFPRVSIITLNTDFDFVNMFYYEYYYNPIVKLAYKYYYNPIVKLAYKYLC